MANAEVAILVSAKDQASSTLQKVNGQLKQGKAEADKTKLAWDALTKAAIGISAGAAGALALVESNKELNTSLSRTGVTLGLTRSQMQDMANATADAGFPLKEVAATFDVLAKSGVTNTDALQASAQAFDSLADATGGSADVLASTLIPGMKALGEQIPTTSEEMDKFTFLANQTSVTLEDFGSVMNYVALYGQDLNLTSKDIVATLAALEAQGISGSAATRDFRTAVKEAADESKLLADATKVTEQAMKDVEGAQKAAADAADALNDAQANAADAAERLRDAQDNLSDATASGEIALQRNAWRQEDLRKIIAKTKAGTREHEEAVLDLREAEMDRTDIVERMTDAQEDVTDAEGEANKATDDVAKAQADAAKAEDKAKEAAAKLTKAQQDEEVAEAASADTTGRLYEALGLTKDQVEAYKSQVDAAAGSTDTYAAAAEGNLTAMDTLKNKFGEAALKLTEFLGPLEPLLIALTALAPVIMGIKAAKEAWTIAQTALNVALNANPIGLVVLAIAALIAIVVLVVKYWDPIKEFFIKLWGVIQSAFETAINFIKGIVETVFNAVKGFIETVWNGISAFFVAIWEGIKAIFSAVVEWLKEWGVLFLGVPGLIIKYWDELKGMFTAAWNRIKEVFTKALDAIKDKVSGALDTIKGLWDDLVTFIKGIPGKIVTALSTVYDKVTTPFKDAKDKISEWLGNVKDWFTELPGKIVTALSNVYNSITDKFKTAKDDILGWLGGIGDWFRDLPGKIGGWFSGIADKIKSPFKTGINGIIDAANWMIRQLNKISFTVPDIPGVPRRGETIGIHLSELSRLAKGGIITGPTLLSDLLTGKPLAVAGEAGPEAVVPMGGVARAGGRGTVLNTTVVLQVDHLWGDKEGARKLLDYLLPELRDKQRLALGKALY